MTILLLLASLYIAQTGTLTVPGRITVDDGSPLPMVVRFSGPNVEFGLQASLPGTGSLIGAATMRPDGSFDLALTPAAGTGQFAVTASMVLSATT